MRHALGGFCVRELVNGVRRPYCIYIGSRAFVVDIRSRRELDAFESGVYLIESFPRDDLKVVCVLGVTGRA